MVKLQATAETTTEVAIAPELHAALRRELRGYAAIKRELADLQTDADALAAHIAVLRERSGANSINIEGYGKVTLVEGGVTTKLDRKKLLIYGVPLSVVDSDTLCTSTPRKSYTKITLADAKKDRDDND